MYDRVENVKKYMKSVIIIKYYLTKYIINKENVIIGELQIIRIGLIIIQKKWK